MTRSVNDNQYKQEEKAKQQENQCPTTLPLMTGMVSVVHIRSLRIAVQLMVVTVAVMVVVLVVMVEVVVVQEEVFVSQVYIAPASTHMFTTLSTNYEIWLNARETKFTHAT
jgi:uncharacterized membrane protein YeiB